MPCVDNKNLIYNIKELPETFSVAAGDMLIIETDDGTNIMDFNNFVIGLDNTTFGTTITQHSTDINTMYSDIDTLSAEVEANLTQSTTDIAAISAAFITDTTKCLITLSAQNEFGPTLVKSSNVSSVTWEANELTFNFTTNFADTDYLVLPSINLTAIGSPAALMVTEKSTNYVKMKLINTGDGNLISQADAVGGFAIETF